MQVRNQTNPEEQRLSNAAVLVGVDGSSESQRALGWALGEARTRGIGLVAAYAWHAPTLAYSVPYFLPIAADEMIDEGRKVLQSTLTRSGANPGSVDTRVVEGNAATVLRNLARQPGVELVVVGSRGRGTSTDIFLGSTSHALSHSCAKPLVIVPSREGDESPAPRVGHVVVGTDGSGGGDDAVRWAADEARRTDSLLEVVLAWTLASPFHPADVQANLPMESQLEAAAQRALGEIVERLELHGLSVKLTPARGTAADVLVERSREADMLVVGRRGLGRARELFLGSVSHACVHRSEVPVVLVPDS